MEKISTLLILLAVACTSTKLPVIRPDNSFVPAYPIDRFEKVIRGYEQRDSIRPPGQGNVVFGGSSSIFFWETLSTDMQPMTAVNYGFGGSTFPEVTHYAERTILKNNPKAIVIYCENDLYGDQPKSVAQVVADYQKLVKTIRQKLPSTPLFFIALKPSPSRWKRWSESEAVNTNIRNYIAGQKNQYFIDIVPYMLKNGRPDPAIFVADSLHMNDAGYARWTNVIQPFLREKLN